MLKRPIKYTSFDDEECEEDFYFNISEAEMVELESKKEEGYAKWLENLIKSNNTELLFAEFKKIVLMSCGEKSPDGKHFMKTDDIRAKFEGSAAYNALIYEMFSSEDVAAEFLSGVFPKRIREELAKTEATTEKAGMATASGTPEIPPVPPKI